MEAPRASFRRYEVKDFGCSSLVDKAGVAKIAWMDGIFFSE